MHIDNRMVHVRWCRRCRLNPEPTMLGNSLQQGLQPLVAGARALPMALSTVREIGGFVTGSPLNSAAYPKGRLTTPLDIPLKGPASDAPAPASGPALVKAPTPQAGSLAAGVKIVAMPTPGPLATLAVYLDAGSANEPPSAVGVSRLLQYAAFKATANRSTFSLTRELEKIGAVPSASVGREHIALSLDFPRTLAPDAAELLMDSTLCAKFADWEVRDLMPHVQQVLAAAMKTPALVMDDLLHRAAFTGGLGNVTMPDPGFMDSLDHVSLLDFAAQVMVPPRMLVAAAGLELADVKALVEPVMQGGAAAAPAPAPPSAYTGGYLAAITSGSATHVAIAFEAAGGLSSAKSAACAKVVAAMLSSGSGRVPYSRTDYGYPTASVCSLYKSTGLVGLTASAAPSKVNAAVDALTAKLQGLPKAVNDANLKAAKAAVLATIKSEMASSRGVVNAIAQQMLSTGKFDAAAPVAAVTSLTAADVSSYVSKMLKSKPTVAVFGSLAAVPRYEDIAKRF